MLMFNLSLNDFISAETLITCLYSTVISNKYYTLMLHKKRCKKWLKCCKLYSFICDPDEKMWIFGFSLGVCSTKLHNLVSSLKYLVSNGRQVLLRGIRLGGSTTILHATCCCCTNSARHCSNSTCCKFFCGNNE